MYLEVYELDPASFLSATAWQAALKSAKIKLYLLTDINMLLIIEKVTRGEICHTIYRYTKVNNKYMKYFDKNTELSYLKYWDINNFMNVTKIACRQF